MSFSRRTILVASSGVALMGALGLAGCQQGAYTPTDGDMALGPADAKVTLLEYFSTTCGHCAQFHATIYPQIKTNYVDTGKIRYVFRELLTAPASASLAGFQMARCGGATPDQYMARVGAIFDRQAEVFGGGSPAAIRDQLVAIGRASGLSEDEVRACLSDESGKARAEAFEQQAARDNIDSTPGFLINGRLFSPTAFDYAQFAQALDEAIAAAN